MPTTPEGILVPRIAPWVCPADYRPVSRVPLQVAEKQLGGSLEPVPRENGSVPPLGATHEVMLCPSHGAYPVMGEIPVLLRPELLRPHGEGVAVDLQHPAYAEAYAEMEFYNSDPAEDPAMLTVLQEITKAGLTPASFPDDLQWIDAAYDGPAQQDCYRHLAPVAGRVTMQLGGSGMHAVKFLLAGATHAIVITPMIAEARRALWLAEQMGVSGGLCVALGLAEEIPLPEASIAAVFSGGCAHHMQLSKAMPEICRVLSDGGRFAAAEPWRAPLYRLGTKLFGKREANAFCSPLTDDRVHPFRTTFKDAKLVHHGAVTRYPMIALGKMGIRPQVATLLRIFAADDWLSERCGVRQKGSSVAMLAGKKDD